MKTPETKLSNPKYNAGMKKVSLHSVPCGPMFELGLAFTEGARKYGSHNYRDVGVRSSVYYDAVMRHIVAYWEGEDIDPASGVHHLMKAAACLFILRDSIIMGNNMDDRPIRYPSGVNIDAFNKQTEGIIERYPDCVRPFIEIDAIEKNYQAAVDHETGDNQCGKTK